MTETPVIFNILSLVLASPLQQKLIWDQIATTTNDFNSNFKQRRTEKGGKKTQKLKIPNQILGVEKKKNSKFTKH